MQGTCTLLADDVPQDVYRGLSYWILGDY